MLFHIFLVLILFKSLKFHFKSRYVGLQFNE